MKSVFRSQKAVALGRLREAGEKKGVDLGILPLLDYLNSLSDYYTTSSCSGRITLFHDVGRKLEGSWVGKWHRPVEFSEVWGAMQGSPPQGVVWFLYEPAILHIVSKELGGALKLLNIARESGFKKVGIQSSRNERILVEICSTERVDAPVIHDGVPLVDEDYLRYLVNVANDKFRGGRFKLERLRRNIRNKL